MAAISLQDVSKVYANGVRAVDDLRLEIADGEFLVLVGPSGCGKSTLLRMIAGLEDVSGGEITIGSRTVTDLSPGERDIAMVFQNYALYPHMDVRQNLGYSLRVRRTRKDEVRRRADAVARMLGLEGLLDRRPGQLSGGQRQRVAIGRAIVREPACFLMDEPLSNLDAKLRVSMRGELARLHERIGVTTVYVTHDQIEAMTLGARVAVMRDGVLQQCDEPQRLFERPANLFVAAFMGSPAMNLVEAVAARGRISFAGQELVLPADHYLAELARRIILGVRPTDFAPAWSAAPMQARLSAEVSVVERLGAEQHVLFPLDAERVNTDATRAATEDDEGTLLADDRRAVFVAKLDGTVAVEAGTALELALDVDRLYAFDPETGETIGSPSSYGANGRVAIRA